MKLYVKRWDRYPGNFDITVSDKQYAQSVGSVISNGYVPDFGHEAARKLAYQFAASGAMVAALESALIAITSPGSTTGSIDWTPVLDQMRSAINSAKGPQV